MTIFLQWILRGFLFTGITGVLSLPSPAWAGGKVLLWQSRDQFVAVEAQDTLTDGTAPANEHPLKVLKEQLSYLFGAIDLRSGNGETSEPLFTPQTLQLLTPYIQKALQQAGPTEDVTFAAIGLHDALYGLAKRPKVTTGRLFYQGGVLNLIVGIAQQDVDDRDDRRLKPFTPGARRKPVTSGEWTLVPHSGEKVFTLKRVDWVEFDRELLTAPPPAAVAPQVIDRKPSVVQPIRAAELSPADRLTTLNELRNKGLITDEEFRAKRLEILKEL